MRAVASALILLAACGSTPRPPAAPLQATGLHAEAVAAQVQPYLDGEIATGVVVALIDHGQVETYGFGRVKDGSDAPPDAGTVFEIGAVSQVFTALAVGDAVARGELSLDTPLAQLLPFGVRVPSADDKPILVGHLVTHTSGLPPVPPSTVQRLAEPDPFAGYTSEQLFDDVGRAELAAAPGERFAYSNFGYAVLGQGLAHKAGGSWDAVVTERLLKPLGLTHTTPADPARAAAVLAPGHDSDLAVAPPSTPGAMAPAGGLWSTAGDLSAFVRANLVAAKDPKSVAPMAGLLRKGQDSIVDTKGAGRALAWFIDERGRRWQNGSTSGHHAFVSFDPAHDQGVVVLAATSTSLVDRLGEHMMALLAGDPPKPVQFPDAAAMAPLVGTYDLSGQVITISAKGRRLYARSGDDAPTRLVPLSATEFLIEEAEALMVFEVDAGRALRLNLVLGDQKLVAERTDKAPEAAPAPQK